MPQNNARVQAIICPDPKGLSRLFARVLGPAGLPLIGPIQNAGEVPEASRVPDVPVELVVASISSDGKQIAFRWPPLVQPPAASKPKRPGGRS